MTQKTIHRIGRRPQAHVCQCDATILTAWDADMAAILVHLDPWALTTNGEQWARQQQLRTYHLNIHGIHTRYKVTTPPPGQNHIVLAQHRCGNPVPEPHRLQRTKPNRARPNLERSTF